MTGPEHYAQAEGLLYQVRQPFQGRFEGNAEQMRQLLAEAQIHATLALAAATAVAHAGDMIVADHDAWCDAASAEPMNRDGAT